MVLVMPGIASWMEPTETFFTKLQLKTQVLRVFPIARHSDKGSRLSHNGSSMIISHSGSNFKKKETFPYVAFSYQ